MATHSSILAWRIPWTEEPGRLQSMGLQRVGHTQRLTPPPYGSVGAGKPGSGEAFDKISAVLLTSIRLPELVVVL